MFGSNAKKEDKDVKLPDPAPEAVQANETPTAPGKKIEVEEAAYQKLVQEAAEYKDRCIRLYAEFENARKRFARDKEEFVKYANEGLLTEFLNVLDDLERAVNAAATKHEDYEAFLKGVEMVMARVYDLLKRNQVKPMDVVGKKFDPHCHEILQQAPSDGQEDGTVLEEFQRGYFLGDKVIRTAKVKVAVPPTAPNDSSETKT